MSTANKVIGWFFLGSALLLEVLAVYFIAAGRTGGRILLVVGLALLSAGIVTLSRAKKISG